MITDPRALAAQALARVVSGGESLSGVLPGLQAVCTDPRDAALLQELAFGTLRWYFRLDALARHLLRKPLKARDTDVYVLLLSGIYQLGWMALPLPEWAYAIIGLLLLLAGAHLTASRSQPVFTSLRAEPNHVRTL